MDVVRLLVAVMVTGAVVLPAEAHPGPEQHPTVLELEETAADLRRAIGDVERRLRERIDVVEPAASGPDGQAIAEAVDRAVSNAAAELGRSTDALNDRVDTIGAIGAVVLAGLGGMSAFVGLRLRAVRKTLWKLVEDARGAEETVGAERGDTSREGEDEEEKDEARDVRRVVTHTLKDRISAGMRPTIRELHHPGQPWSPRTVDDAVADIEERGIQYVARGPLGNEADVEVRRRSGKPYLSTKPDEHGGNNLSELPDPS